MKGNLLSLIGWIFRKKKYGFTLIELNISMFIQLIVLTLAFNTAIITFRNYSLLINNSKVQDSFDDAVLNIERLLKGYMIESIKIKGENENNKGEILIIYKKDNNQTDVKKKKVYLDSSKKKIVLETYNKNDFKIGTNIIMTDVSDFKIAKKNNIYYLKIINFNRDERIICI
ncbi:PilW family protein [Clostridium nigeriense]|uniref:PilW family protein n=1 Tax=Clostridium nigeriense TaxID=1805470 RepID=UPI003D33D332